MWSAVFLHRHDNFLFFSKPSDQGFYWENCIKIMSSVWRALPQWEARFLWLYLHNNSLVSKIRSYLFMLTPTKISARKFWLFTIGRVDIDIKADLKFRKMEKMAFHNWFTNLDFWITTIIDKEKSSRFKVVNQREGVWKHKYYLKALDNAGEERRISLSWSG